MAKNYLCNAIADSMFMEGQSIIKLDDNMSYKQFMEYIIGRFHINTFNKSHTAFVEQIAYQFPELSQQLVYPEKPVSIKAEDGDHLFVFSFKNPLPRLTENRHYTLEELQKAELKISHYVVLNYIVNYQDENSAEFISQIH